MHFKQKKSALQALFLIYSLFISKLDISLS